MQTTMDLLNSVFSGWSTLKSSCVWVSVFEVLTCFVLLQTLLILVLVLLSIELLVLVLPRTSSALIASRWPKSSWSHNYARQRFIGTVHKQLKPLLWERVDLYLKQSMAAVQTSLQQNPWNSPLSISFSCLAARVIVNLLTNSRAVCS